MRDQDNTVTHLEVVVERDDIAVALGHLLQDGNLVPDLAKRTRRGDQI